MIFPNLPMGHITDIKVCQVWGYPRVYRRYFDTKHSIYKHHISDIGRYKGLADIRFEIKV
jgi:hypothetical protein